MAVASYSTVRGEMLCGRLTLYPNVEVILVTSLLEYLVRNGVASMSVSLAMPQNDRRRTGTWKPYNL